MSWFRCSSADRLCRRFGEGCGGGKLYNPPSLKGVHSMHPLGRLRVVSLLSIRTRGGNGPYPKRLKDIYAKRAKERQVEAGKTHGRGQEKVPENLPEPKSDARDEAGAAVGVSGRSIDQDRDAAKLWIIDNQFGRRNLADIDRIGLAKKKHDIEAGKAKENQRQSKGRGKKVAQNCATLKPIKTSKICAKSAGVGEPTYDAGKLILDAAETKSTPTRPFSQNRRARRF